AAPGREGPRHVSRQQDCPAPARRDEALDGSADPSLQALYRRLPCSCRRGLCRGRGAQGRVRGLPRRRRHQQTVPLQDPRAVVRASADDGRHVPRPHARGRRRDPRLDRHRVRRGRPLMAVRRLAPPEQQPKSFAFTAENRAWAENEITKYPHGRQASAIIPLVWRAQEQSGGWLPEAAIRAVADQLGLTHIRALEVATFYTMFNLAPIGRTYVQLCGTT